MQQPPCMAYTSCTAGSEDASKRRKKSTLWLH